MGHRSGYPNRTEVSPAGMECASSTAPREPDVQWFHHAGQGLDLGRACGGEPSVGIPCTPEPVRHGQRDEKQGYRRMQDAIRQLNRLLMVAGYCCDYYSSTVYDSH